MKIMNHIRNLFMTDDDRLNKIKEISDEILMIESEKDFLSEKYMEFNKAISCDDFQCKEEIKAKFPNENSYLAKLASLKRREDKLNDDLSFFKSLEGVKLHDHNQKVQMANEVMKGLYRAGKLTLEQYGEVLGEKTEKGQTKYADIIVLNSLGELLLLKRSLWEDKHKGAWVIPGGHVDKGESCEQAAKRELLEEAGISVDDLITDEKIFPAQWVKLGVVENKDAHVSYYCLNGVRVEDIEILLDDSETRDYMWMNRLEIDNYPMVFDMQKNIKELLGWKDLPHLHIIRKAIKEGVINIEGIQGIAKSLPHKYIKKEIGSDGKFNYFYPAEKSTNKKSDNYEYVKNYSEEVISGRKQIKRLSSSEEQGRLLSGRANVEATILIGTDERAISKSESSDERREWQELILEDFAKSNKLWKDRMPEFSPSGFIDSGAEAKVYYFGNNNVVKVNNLSQHEEPIEFLDRLALHNYLFPETKYQVLGFTKMDGDFSVIVKQQFIQGESCPKMKVISDMESRGFEYLGGNMYKNDDYLIEDLHGGNVLIDDGGNIFYIDPIIRVNLNGEGYGGNRELEGIEKAIKEKLIGGEADGKTLQDIADHHKVELSIIEHEFKLGQKVESEHTKDQSEANEIAKDHLWEIADYYTRLDKMEADAKGDEIEKARDLTKLTKIKRLVKKDGKVFLQTFYVKTGEISEEEIGKETEFNDDTPKVEIGRYFEIETSRKKFEGRAIDIHFDKSTDSWYLLSEDSGDKIVWSKMTAIKSIKQVKKEEEIELPNSLSELNYVRSLGGSSDVTLMSDTKGNLFAVKKQRDRSEGSSQLVDEVIVDKVYGLLDILTPESNIIYGDDGDTYKISRYLHGSELGSLRTDKAQGFYEEIKKGFVLDCLLANWDVIGTGKDNILIYDGKPYRIDNGSALRHRAKGALKGSLLGSEVAELKTMLDPLKNPYSAEVYKGITQEEIKEQIRNILGKKKEILDKISLIGDDDLTKVMGSRIDYLESKISEKKEEKPKEVKLKKDMPSMTTQNYFDNGWDELELEGNPGIKNAIKEQILKIEKSRKVEYENYARIKGVSVEEYKKLLQKAVERAVNKSEFFRATHCNSQKVKSGETVNALDYTINKDGRFKSQFEVGKSDGSLDWGYRAAIENKYFGFTKDMNEDKEKRPIYGYFSTDKNNGIINRVGKIPPPNVVDYYGEVIVKVKRESAMKKATISFTDSLSSSFSIACTPAAKPHFTSLKGMYYDELIELLESEDGVSLNGSSYVEVQYHNQLTVNDIESIHVTNRVYDDVSDKLSYDELNSTIEYVTNFIAHSGNKEIKLKVY